MNASRDTKNLIMTLAVAAVGSLIGMTWALTRVSAWIVFHDEVWERMDREGARMEHDLAEMFHIAGWLHIVAIEAVVGVIFLVLLWRTLYGSPATPDGNGDSR